MRRLKLGLLVGMMMLGALPAAVQSPEELLSQAKLSMFDGQWTQALDQIHRLRTLSPREDVLTSSYFYEARVLEKLGRLSEALETYDVYLGRSGRDSALTAEARSSVIRLAVDLYRAGRKGHLDRALAALRSGDRDLAFLAALQLSRLPEEGLRRQAVPVLQRELRESSDAEVRNQASLALLRIDPRLLEPESVSRPEAAGGVSRDPKETAGRNLRLVFRDGDGEELRLNLPLSLARLLLASLPDSAKADLRKEGIQADNLVEELSKAGEILEIRTSDGLIRIWID
jgi:tetratricopeptide (TPR) repeat protein